MGAGKEEEENNCMAESTKNNNDGDENERKIHISRIPPSFDEDAVKRILEEKLGGKGDDIIEDITLIYKRPEQQDKKEEEEGRGHQEKYHHHHDKNSNAKNADQTTTEHRGFGFVTFVSNEIYQQAIKLQSIRGGRKATSTRKHTMYLRPYIGDDDESEKNDGLISSGSSSKMKKNICFLWSQYRCPWGTECKFLHEGDGGCLEKPTTKKKKQKCFAYKKGKCKRGDDCPFSHDFVVVAKNVVQNDNDDDDDDNKKKGKDKDNDNASKKKKADSEKDCINWKTKGKCRKIDTCPYRHDESVREAALLKKKRKQQQQQQQQQEDDDDSSGLNNNNNNNHKNKKARNQKQKQPLWVRIFGLNYETREVDVRDFLQHCGTISKVEFPRFEDSGRSKGYCGVLFQSPKAAALAVELDGQELMGRWLRIQSGKMLLDQWEE